MRTTREDRIAVAERLMAAFEAHEKIARDFRCRVWAPGGEGRPVRLYTTRGEYYSVLNDGSIRASRTHMTWDHLASPIVDRVGKEVMSDLLA